jgi:hypothetical protein
MQNLYIAILIGGAVAAGGGYVAYQQYQAPEEPEGETEEMTAAEMRGTFAAMLALGQNLVCTFEHDDGENVSSGTVYMADGAARIRGDFNVVASAGGPMEASMVRVDGYNYLWGSFMESGVKVKVTEEDEGKLFSDESDVEIDENTDFDCDLWNVDASKFNLPSDVEFIDIAAQMEATIGASLGGQCSTCDMAPAGAAREQCKAALGCE